MKDRLDAARVKLSSIVPSMTQVEIDRIISHLSHQLTGDELGSLINQTLREQQEATAAMYQSSARLDALVKARKKQRFRDGKSGT